MRVLEAIDLHDRDDLYYALRALFTTRREDLGPFDEAFAAWWCEARGEPPPRVRRRGAARDTSEPPRPPRVPGDPAAAFLVGWASRAAAVDDGAGPVGMPAPSTREGARRKDFGSYGSEELGAIERAAARIARALRARPSRRWVRATRGRRIDLRRLARRMIRTGGEPLDLPLRRRKPRRTKLVVLCDVSGSMDLYSRFLLQCLYAIQRAFARVETFVFSTRLVRITEALDRHGYREVLDALADTPGWSGGTRIGESLAALRLRWPRLLDRRTVVIVLSDGWDTGDPELLAASLRFIGRRVGRVVWLNPLLGNAEYRPLTRGMQAALPFVGVFASLHDLASLEALAGHLGL